MVTSFEAEIAEMKSASAGIGDIYQTVRGLREESDPVAFLLVRLVWCFSLIDMMKYRAHLVIPKGVPNIHYHTHDTFRYSDEGSLFRIWTSYAHLLSTFQVNCLTTENQGRIPS